MPIIQKYIDENNIDTYIEPMVGGCNIIDKVYCEHKIGSDSNDELIALLKYVQIDNNLYIAPEECTFEHYKDVRQNRKNNTGKYSRVYTALIGYCASFGGRYYSGGYGRDSKGGRSIYKERLKNLKTQAPLLDEIDFRCCDYKVYADYKNCLFYFDPPYFGCKQYDGQKIDYDEFYEFIIQLSKNNIVLVSEYQMPEENFECIWSKQRSVLQKSDRVVGDTAVEKLFIYNGEDRYLKKMKG